MQTDPEDFWSSDNFEDNVAAALIACYETKPRKNRGAAPADRLTEDRIAVMRQEGPYIPSPSRGYLVPTEAADSGYFDVVNDPLPAQGMYAGLPRGKLAQSQPNAYFVLTYVKRASALGKYWQRASGGALYEMLTMDAESDGIHGERRFFTVATDGMVIACRQPIQHGSPGARRQVSDHSREWLSETSYWAAVALQAIADRRFCWVITAQEREAKAHLGCMMEEVKSLLYARSLPITETGRKRPILHLVAAHKRRMRAGIDVDVTAFLRGQQKVEIGGTMFSVNPPAVLRPKVSAASGRYFPESATSAI